MLSVPALLEEAFSQVKDTGSTIIDVPLTSLLPGDISERVLDPDDLEEAYLSSMAGSVAETLLGGITLLSRSDAQTTGNRRVRAIVGGYFVADGIIRTIAAYFMDRPVGTLVIEGPYDVVQAVRAGFRSLVM